MRLRATAKTPGECCWSICDKPATKIFDDGEYKYLACCKAHAIAVAGRVRNLSDETRKVLWGR